MFVEPRVWKWLGPAGAMVALVPLAAWINLIAERNVWDWLVWCNCLVVGLMPFLGLQVWAGFVAYYRRLDVDDFVTRRRAEVLTPQNILAESMKQMHPHAIDILAMYGRSTWMLIPGASPKKDEAMWILYGTQVTSAFIYEFLRTSTTTACVPMYKFANDGAKLYAPVGMKDSWCSDREQYKQFVEYLFGVSRVTQAHGNLPAEFIAPWNPENVARAMGFELWDEEELLEVENKLQGELK